jgi:flagellar protein FliO/FliZ
MTQAIFSVVAFLVLLALVPFGIRWIQRRAPGGASATGASRIVSAIAVGPHQRVVTVEVGPEGARTWLVLGVTAQSITCLHSAAVGKGQDQDVAAAAPGAPLIS